MSENYPTDSPTAEKEPGGSSLPRYLVEHLHDFFHRIHWDTLCNLEIRESADLDHLLLARVSLEDWIIRFDFTPSFEEEFTRLIETDDLYKLCEPDHLLKTGSPLHGLLQRISPRKPQFHATLHDYLSGIAYHEFGHSKECPVDRDGFSLVVQAVTSALEQEERFNKQALNYLVNIFTDLIINLTYGLDARNAFFRNALFLHHTSEVKNQDQVDLVFSFFVLLHARLFHVHPPFRSLLDEMLSPRMPEGYVEELKRMTRVFVTDDKIAEERWLGLPLTEESSWTGITYISDRDTWPRMAHELTLALSRYLPAPELLDDTPVPDSAFTRQFREDPSFRRDIADRIMARKCSRGRGTAGKRRDRRDEKYNRSGEKGGGGSTGENYAGEWDVDSGLSWMDRVEFLDSLYRTRTRNLEVRAESHAEENQMPIVWMNREVLSERDDPLDIDPMMVYFLPNTGDVLAYKKSLPLVERSKSYVRHKGFPNLLLVCDDSGSMDWHPLEDKGRYNALLVMIYSILHWLENANFSSVIEYNLTLFSDTTRSTGWVDYFHLKDDLLPMLFDPEGGSTVLSPEVLASQLSSPREKVVILITDGEIFNSKAIKGVLDEHRTAIKFLFVQIGKTSNFGLQLEKAGYNVLAVSDLDNIAKLVLDFVEDSYVENYR
ncbi:MAG: hypothetical protein ACTSU5_18205 [Promethearchaeota archaeon]